MLQQLMKQASLVTSHCRACNSDSNSNSAGSQKVHQIIGSDQHRDDQNILLMRANAQGKGMLHEVDSLLGAITDQTSLQ